MGIRYFAHPLSPTQIRQSQECPRGCYEYEDDWEHWGPGATPTLDLGKCYPELQWVLNGEPPRRALALVEGAVAHTGWGWRPFRRILEPDEVLAIADDLDQLLASPEELSKIGCRFDGADCVTDNLLRARDFARQGADAGFGTHYSIG